MVMGGWQGPGCTLLLLLLLLPALLVGVSSAHIAPRRCYTYPDGIPAKATGKADYYANAVAYWGDIRRTVLTPQSVGKSVMVMRTKEGKHAMLGGRPLEADELARELKEARSGFLKGKQGDAAWEELVASWYQTLVGAEQDEFINYTSSIWGQIFPPPPPVAELIQDTLTHYRAAHWYWDNHQRLMAERRGMWVGVLGGKVVVEEERYAGALAAADLLTKEFYFIAQVGNECGEDLLRDSLGRGFGNSQNKQSSSFFGTQKMIRRECKAEFIHSPGRIKLWVPFADQRQICVGSFRAVLDTGAPQSVLMRPSNEKIEILGKDRRPYVYLLTEEGWKPFGVYQGPDPRWDSNVIGVNYLRELGLTFTQHIRGKTNCVGGIPESIPQDEITYLDSPILTEVYHHCKTCNISGVAEAMRTVPNLMAWRSADKKGPLFWAFEHKCWELAALMIKAGARDDVTDSNGNSPVARVSEKNQIIPVEQVCGSLNDYIGGSPWFVMCRLKKWLNSWNCNIC